jgi:hypothetical protein
VNDDDLEAPDVEVELLLREAAAAEARGQVMRARLLRRVAHELADDAHHTRLQMIQPKEHSAHMSATSPKIYPVGTRVTMRPSGIGAKYYGEVGTVTAVNEHSTTVHFERVLTVTDRDGDRGADHVGEHRLWISLEDQVAEERDTDA